MYVGTDACGGVGTEAHEGAAQRMVQTGVQPMTWLQYLLELRCERARAPTTARGGDIAREHGGTYGPGAEYIYRMPDRDRSQRPAAS